MASRPQETTFDNMPWRVSRPRSGTQVVLRLRHAVSVVSELTKARLVSLVVITTAVGYLMAGGPAWSLPRLIWTIVGTALAAAGSMALNEWLEAERDARMRRTRGRPIPTGQVTRPQALVLGITLAASGLGALAWRTTGTTAALGLAVVLVYVFVYTPLKPRTPLCTLAGAVCGALPPMMGWAAVDGSLAFGAWLLAGILFLWQIPHFLALAWLYREDYERGGFRMLPVIDPDGHRTVHVVTLYTVALLPVALAAPLAGLTGWIYGAGSVVLGGGLLAAGVALARARSDSSARRLFLVTLLYLPLLLGLMVADRHVVSSVDSGLIRDGRVTRTHGAVHPELSDPRLDPAGRP